MKKEYHAELRQLKTVERKLDRDWQALLRSSEKQIAQLRRQQARGYRATAREVVRVQRRRAILKGRLS